MLRRPRRHFFRGALAFPARLGGLLVLAFTFALSPVPLRAHDEWNQLHIVYNAQDNYTYPFDGRSPKIAVALLNHYTTPSTTVALTLSVNGQRPNAAGFATFPTNPSIVVAPDEVGIVSVLSRGVYDDLAGTAPAVGQSKDVTFDFTFTLGPGGAPAGDTPATLPYTQSQVVRFTNLGDNPVLTGPLSIAGALRLGSSSVAPVPASARVEVATPYSPWLPVTLVPTSINSAPTFTFFQALPFRNDWHIRFSADGYETRVVELGPATNPTGNLDVTLEPATVPDLDYRRAAAIATPTGFWRGAVSENEGTFVVFPGQETWPAAATDAAARALRSAGRIYKYKFDGTKLWEHAPGWETWAGDMTPDGRFVAYALNPTTTPTENKLVLLDGATGAVLWTKSASLDDPAVGRKLDALELAFSPDARWLAVGSAARGTVTLVDRATGNLLWTVPGPTGNPDGFGSIRKLRFSPDSQFLYCGSGDSMLRKLRTNDGVVLWRVFAGGWPFVNGLDLTPDGAWLAAGTKSLDLTLIRTSDGFTQWQRETQFVDAVTAPDGRHVATAGGQIYRLFDGSLAGMTKNAALTRFTPDGRGILQFGRDLRLYDLGGKLLKTFEASGLAATAAEQPQWSHLTRDGRYAILLAHDMSAPAQTGIVIYERRAAAANAGPSAAPVIAAQPLAQTVTAGASATLAITATGAAPLAYQWRKDGTDLTGQNSAVLALAAVSGADAGAYTCIVTNAAGTATSAAAPLAVVAPDAANPTRLANLAVRARVGATPLIVGFAVGGAGTAGQKTLLIRGAGPSLIPLGVADALPDPRLTLFAGGAVALSNDNWANNADVAALATQFGAFPFTSPTSKDAALAATAVGGSYTVQLASADAASGTALAEIYDGTGAFAATTPRLVNVSARTDAGPGAAALIAGFVVAGPAAKTVLIRAIGPGLAAFGVRDALADPQLTLYRDTTVLAANDNWHEAPNALAIASAAGRVGAFSLPPPSRDAALLLSLPPGSYTAQVTGTTAATGNALIEVYEVP